MMLYYENKVNEFLKKTSYIKYDNIYSSGKRKCHPYDCIYYIIDDKELKIIIQDKYYHFKMTDKLLGYPINYKDFIIFEDLIKYFNIFFKNELRLYKLKYFLNE